jgi:hypothetical protein
MKPWVDDVSGASIVPPLSPDWRPLPPARLRSILGRAEHQIVAEEMRQTL